MEQVHVSWSLQRSWWGWVAIDLVARMGFVLCMMGLGLGAEPPRQMGGW